MGKSKTNCRSVQEADRKIAANGAKLRNLWLKQVHGDSKSSMSGSKGMHPKCQFGPGGPPEMVGVGAKVRGKHFLKGTAFKCGNLECHFGKGGWQHGVISVDFL